MAWHMGHPLSQTLFTSIYLDKLLYPAPRTMEDARFDRVSSESPLISLVLRAYCLALVKACDLVHSRIVTEYYFEVSWNQRPGHLFGRKRSANIVPPHRKKTLFLSCIIGTSSQVSTHHASSACWTRRWSG